ncbi:MAG: hypothetical protein GF418_03030 [Chitinivibrionales bacterium]|nr:hypothetical protein [Chitinivibrionales bacterium]MBD3394576.1 hypothetical protein [Chitinivibrionales bacterium]
MSFLGVEQKKGAGDILDGRLTVYARVDLDLSDILSSKHPIASMVNNGLLVVQGNYREQSNLRDFLKSEMGLSLEEGLSEFLEKLDGLESALDPDKLREKMENIGDIQEFIPTPAKIVPFGTEEEILKEEGDVYYTGEFRNVANANLSVNSFPIIYQARFREQEIVHLRDEIETLISQVENNEMPETFSEASGGGIEDKVFKELLPYLLYSRKEKGAFDKAQKKFRSFLNATQFQEDVNRIVAILERPGDLATRDYKLLELHGKRIVATGTEQYEKVDQITREIVDTSAGPEES